MKTNLIYKMSNNDAIGVRELFACHLRLLVYKFYVIFVTQCTSVATQTLLKKTLK